MGTTIQRQLPQSNESRKLALDSSKTKNDNLPVGTVILTPATETRLNTIQPVYNGLMIALGSALAVSTNATNLKNIAQETAKMWTSHYYQALNNAIARGVYPASVRAFFNIDVSSDAVPEMDTEEKVKLAGERVSSGQTAMVAAGHAAIPFPTEPDVRAKVNDYKTKLIAQSTAMDATDTAQEDIEAQNTEADKVIKKVWDEVETFYNEETPESMRNNARQWGVIYITLGEITEITFHAVRRDNGAPLPDVEFKIKSTGNTYTSDDTGNAVAETRIVGAEKVTATCTGFIPLEQSITIVEGVAMTVTFTMDVL